MLILQVCIEKNYTRLTGYRTRPLFLCYLLTTRSFKCEFGAKDSNFEKIDYHKAPQLASPAMQEIGKRNNI